MLDQDLLTRYYAYNAFFYFFNDDDYSFMTGPLFYNCLTYFYHIIYNNLSFANLAVFDPTTYFMLLQTRLLLTGVFYQVLFMTCLPSTYIPLKCCVW